MFVGRQRHVCRAAKACLSGGKCTFVGRQRHVCRAAKAAKECLSGGKGMFVGLITHFLEFLGAGAQDILIKYVVGFWLVLVAGWLLAPDSWLAS